jgi:hypothetical protein
MYSQDNFTTVVFSANEFNYWVSPAASASSAAVPSLPARDFFPRLVQISSMWETHSVLVGLPTGSLLLAPRKADWEVAIPKALRETLADLRVDTPANATARAKWVALVGTKATPLAPPSGLYVIPSPASLNQFSLLPRIPWEHRDPVPAAEQVSASIAVAPHMRTVRSSLGQPERRAPPRALALVPVAAAGVTVALVPVAAAGAAVALAPAAGVSVATAHYASAAAPLAW